MSNLRESTTTTAEDLQVPMPTVAKFVRQLSHDLRNHLNAAELQSAYISEIAADGEIKEEVKRLRAMLSELGGSLQSLTTSLAPINLTLMPYEAANFIADVRQKMESKFAEESKGIDWAIDAGNSFLNIDPQILQQAFLEIFANAFQHQRGSGQLKVKAEANDGRFVFTLAEPKNLFSGSTENWGGQPFAAVKHGHYGLGLPRVRSIIEEHQGEFTARYDSDSLVTTIALPIERAP